MVDIAFVFDNAFTGIFKYDKKYDELSFAVSHFNISEYPINLRNIWYKLYPTLLTKYKKLGKVYNKTQLMRDIENDELLKFIPTILIDVNELGTRVLHKLLEDDYNFLQLTERNDRKHFKFHHIIEYDTPELQGWNINTYLNRGLLKVKDLTSCPQAALDHIDMRFVTEHMNRTRSVRCWNRFTNNEHNCMIIPDVQPPLETTLYLKLADEIIDNYEGKAPLTDSVLLNNCSCCYYSSFDLNDNKIAKYVFAEVIKLYNKDYNDQKKNEEMKRKLIESVEDTAQKLASHKNLPHEFLQFFFTEPWRKILSNNQLSLLRLLDSNIEHVDEILEQFPTMYGKWFKSMITSKRLTKANFTQLWDKYSPKIDKLESWKGDLCASWIETNREEPPLQIYVSPNAACGGRNIAYVWRTHVSPDTIPNEMTSVSYWQYMIATSGKKRNPNHTVCYTFFSNSDCNKIVFIRALNELQKPARQRFNIPVDFDELKEFLTEELVTNDICSFKKLTKDDWNKIAGGNEGLDIVAFSEMKNVYNERTPLKEVLGYLKEHIETKFDVELDKI